MPSLQINSTNINTFNFTASFDIKNKQVIFNASGTTYNGASGSGDLYVQGIAFSLIDQDNTPLAVIDWTNPQLPTPATNAIYTLDLSNVNLAYLFQTYRIVGAIKDQDGTVYSTLPVFKKVVQPDGIIDDGSIGGIFQLIPDCVNGNITLKDLTPYYYNYFLPTTITKNGSLFYPTGTIASVPFTYTPFVNNYVISGEYRVNNTSIATYDFGDGVYVILTYITSSPYQVVCNQLMSTILCCITDVQNQMNKNCGNAIGMAAKDKLTAVVVPLIAGFIAEQSGVDASYQVVQIKKILGCDCGCQ